MMSQQKRRHDTDESDEEGQIVSPRISSKHVDKKLRLKGGSCSGSDYEKHKRTKGERRKMKLIEGYSSSDSSEEREPSRKNIDNDRKKGKENREKYENSKASKKSKKSEWDSDSDENSRASKNNKHSIFDIKDKNRKNHSREMDSESEEEYRRSEKEYNKKSSRTEVDFENKHYKRKTKNDKESREPSLEKPSRQKGKKHVRNSRSSESDEDYRKDRRETSKSTDRYRHEKNDFRNKNSRDSYRSRVDESRYEKKSESRRDEQGSSKREYQNSKYEEEMGRRSRKIDDRRFEENEHRQSSKNDRRFRRMSDDDDERMEERPNQRADYDKMPRERKSKDDENKQKEMPSNLVPLSQSKISTVNTRTGGAYIPPARLKLMQEQISDKGCEAYQRLAWEALKKSLIGLTNKVNASNIAEVVREIFKENIVRGKGVLCRSIMQAQSMSQTFTNVYSAFVAIINSKFPIVGELLLKRLIIQFKRSFRRNDKIICIATTKFIAHLLNQQVVHEVVVLQVLLLLLEKPTNDSVEIAVGMLKECGLRLKELSPRAFIDIFEQLRKIMQEAELETRVQYMWEVLAAIRKDNFKDFQSVTEELDCLEEEDKITHLITLDEATDGEDILNVFKFDPEFVQQEAWYKDISKELLGENESGDSDSSDGESGSGSDDEDDEAKKEESQKIVDMTETNLVSLRGNIYLTIQSSLDFEECAHKLLKLQLNPGQIVEMCYMILDCCAQQRTYEKFFGLLAQRFCMLNKIYVEPFTEIFKNSFETIHRVETNKLRNVAKFFAHLLFTDAISWMVLSNIKLNEEDTTSSSRIFIKILFQELCEYMGLSKLNDRINDVTLQEAFDGLFPRDNPRNTRFAINFFTSIGLGGLTDELREHLKSVPKVQPSLNDLAAAAVATEKQSESSEEGENSSDSSSDSDSSSEDSSPKRKKKKSKDKRKSKKLSKKGKSKKKKNQEKEKTERRNKHKKRKNR